MKKNGSITQGFCLYCGQAQNLQGEFESQEQANLCATLHCNCREALDYQKIENARIQAKANVKLLFGERSEAQCGLPQCPDEAVGLLLSVVDMVVDDIIDGASVDLGSLGKAKISITSKKNVRVARYQSKSATLEG